MKNSGITPVSTADEDMKLMQDIPKYFVCQLTRKVFLDPVVVKTG